MFHTTTALKEEIREKDRRLVLGSVALDSTTTRMYPPGRLLECKGLSVGWDDTTIREERTWAIAISTVLREPKFRTEFPYFSRENDPNSEERGIYTNPS